MVEPWGSVGGCRTAGAERSNGSLGDDGADLAGCSGDTVAGGAVASWEALSWHDEGCAVGAEIEEELGQDVAGEEAARANLVVGETHDAEEDGEDDEAYKLDWLTADGVDECDGHPVTWNGTSANQDDVTNSNVVEELVGVGALAVADSLEDGRVVETNTVESNVEQEPGGSSSEEDLAVLPSTDVAAEVSPRWLWDLEMRSRLLHGGDTSDLVRNTFGGSAEVGLDVGATLDNITGDIEGVSWGLFDMR